MHISGILKYPVDDYPEKMNITAWYTYIHEILQGDKVGLHNNLLHAVKACSDCAAFELPEEMLQKAAEFGRVELIAKLLKVFPALSGEAVVNYAMNEAARNGHSKALSVLLNHRCIDYLCDTALEEAAARGHTQCVELLIPFANCLIGNSGALRLAAKGNRFECVKLLLPHSNPLACHAEALQYAASHQNEDMLLLLYPLHSRDQVQDVLEIMEDSVGYEFDQEGVDFLQRWHTNVLLNEAVQNYLPLLPKTIKKI